MPLRAVSPARRSHRIYARLPVTLLIPAQDTKIAEKAFTVDLSPVGARVRTSMPLSPGQRVDVLPAEGLKHVIPSRVVWVGEGNPDRASEAGLEFLEPILAGC